MIAVVVLAAFVPIPKRWIVERAYGILVLHRWGVRDYERLPRCSQSQVYRTMTAVILRQPTGAGAATWRSTRMAGSSPSGRYWHGRRSGRR
ncbi:hypothetical protein ACIQVC_07965 [Streptomyces sp. NPDC101112]|uniref:hypothetical protein n=1 Tax=Streptomyces sp. NPDC101112 TaxID=3366105 RepID=UPI0037F5FD28